MPTPHDPLPAKSPNTFRPIVGLSLNWTSTRVTPLRKRDKDFKISFRMRSTKSATASTCFRVRQDLHRSWVAVIEGGRFWGRPMRPDSAPVSQPGFLRTTIALISRWSSVSSTRRGKWGLPPRFREGTRLP